MYGRVEIFVVIVIIYYREKVCEKVYDIFWSKGMVY